MRIKDVYRVWAWSMLWWFVISGLFVCGVAAAKIYGDEIGMAWSIAAMVFFASMAVLCVVGLNLQLIARWGVIKGVVTVENFRRTSGEFAAIAFRMDRYLTDPEAYQFIYRVLEDGNLISEIEKMLLHSKYPIVVKSNTWEPVVFLTLTNKAKSDRRLFAGLMRCFRGISDRRWCEVEWNRDVMISLRNVRHELGHVVISATSKASHDDQHWILEQARIL